MAFYLILTEVPCVNKKTEICYKKINFWRRNIVFFWPMLIHGSSRKNLPLLPYAKYDETVSGLLWMKKTTSRVLSVIVN